MTGLRYCCGFLTAFQLLSAVQLHKAGMKPDNQQIGMFTHAPLRQAVFATCQAHVGGESRSVAFAHIHMSHYAHLQVLYK